MNIAVKVRQLLEMQRKIKPLEEEIDEVLYPRAQQYLDVFGLYHNSSGVKIVEGLRGEPQVEIEYVVWGRCGDGDETYHETVDLDMLASDDYLDRIKAAKAEKDRIENERLVNERLAKEAREKEARRQQFEKLQQEFGNEGKV